MYNPQGMDYKLSKLSNGLRVVTVSVSQMESVTVSVWVKTGSRNETNNVAGISHFLEHMVFKGGKKYPSAKAISEAVDAIGAEFNAATSKEWTNFFIKSRTGKIETAFDVLSDMVLQPLLKTEDIEREKGVIVEEIAMYEDMPMAHIGDIFERLIFDKTPLGRDVIGTKETVRGIKRSDFERYRKSYYFADNIILTVAGGVTQDRVMDLAKKYFSGLESKGVMSQTQAKVNQKKPQALLHTKKSDQAHFIVGFVGYPRGHKDRYKEAILATILGGGMSSRLFTEVREKRGLCYSVRADVDHFIDTGYFTAYAGVALDKMDEAVKVILDEFYKISTKSSLITPQELAKAKEYIKGHMALSLENTKAINGFYGEQVLFLKRIETPDEVFDRIDKVKSDDLYSLAKRIFVPESLNLAVIGPYKDQVKFEKLLV